MDNQVFFGLMCEWIKKVKDAQNVDDPLPRLSDEIGRIFLLIAERYAMKPSFACLPYKDEMIGDAVENCCQAAKNFDPNKSNKPFAYFTQVISFAFLRRIEKENKQQYIKYKSIDHAAVDSRTPDWLKKQIFGLDRAKIRKQLKLTDKSLANMDAPNPQPVAPKPSKKAKAKNRSKQRKKAKGKRPQKKTSRRLDGMLD